MPWRTSTQLPVPETRRPGDLITFQILSLKNGILDGHFLSLTIWRFFVGRGVFSKSLILKTDFKMEFRKSLSSLHHLYLLPNLSPQHRITSCSYMTCGSPEVYWRRTCMTSGHLVSWGDFLQDRCLCQVDLVTWRQRCRQGLSQSGSAGGELQLSPQAPLLLLRQRRLRECREQSPELILRPGHLPPGHLLSCFTNTLTNHTFTQLLSPQMFTKPLPWESTELGSLNGAGRSAGAGGGSHRWAHAEGHDIDPGVVARVCRRP